MRSIESGAPDVQPWLIPGLGSAPADAPEDGAQEASAGIFPSQLLRDATRSGWVLADAEVREEQIQPASMDLRLGPVAYRVRASFLPGRKRVSERLASLKTHELDLSVPGVLEKGCVYIVPLQERLQLPSNVSARANPKSSTGRLDIFARLITDFSSEFDKVRPGYKGPLYLEVVPQTFSVLAREGTTLAQLRLLRGSPNPSDALVEALHEREALVFGDGDLHLEPHISKGLWISVDLRGGEGQEIVGYRAKAHSPLIDLELIGHYDPREFWEPIYPPRGDQLVLNPEDFYILSSKERIRVPLDAAAEMVSYEPSVGEFRNHYAGFFDPGFGFRGDETKGTHAVLEVRSHEVPFVLEDGQLISRLVYQRLLGEADKAYGATIGSSYQSQRIALSKHFQDWAEAKGSVRRW